MGQPPVLTHLIRFRRFRSSLLALASLDLACRDHRPDFSATFTTIAFDDSSLQWLGISDLIAEPEGPSFISRTVTQPPCGPALLVTQDPHRTLRRRRPWGLIRVPVTPAHQSAPAPWIVQTARQVVVVHMMGTLPTPADCATCTPFMNQIATLPLVSCQRRSLLPLPSKSPVSTIDHTAGGAFPTPAACATCAPFISQIATLPLVTPGVNSGSIWGCPSVVHRRKSKS